MWNTILLASRLNNLKRRITVKIKISEDFSPIPGTRYRDEGEFSGEQFREDLLIKKYIVAKEKKEKLVIDLDGGYGYPTSFLEEAFGGLARIYGSKEILDTLIFISNDEPSLICEIKSYIRSANEK